MNVRMLARRKQDKVRRLIIERILIGVMNVPALGDFLAGVAVFPDFTVQVTDAALEDSVMLIVDPVTALGAVGIASVDDVFISDFNGGFHADSLSP